MTVEKYDVPIRQLDTGDVVDVTVVVTGDEDILATAQEAAESMNGTAEVATDKLDDADWYDGDGCDTTCRCEDEQNEHFVPEPTDKEADPEEIKQRHRRWTDESDERQRELMTPADVLHHNAETYEQKNDDYGDSWRLAGATLARWARAVDADMDLQDEADAIAYGLYIRRMDKFLRAFTLEFGDTETHNEPLVDSHRDESTYAAMHASYVDHVNNTNNTTNDTQ